MATLTKPAATLLAERYRDAAGGPIDAAIPQNFAEELTRQVAAARPKLAVEIGMANGLSSLAMLAGLPAGSRMISIDPFQTSQWHDEGSKYIAACDRAADHELRAELDYVALPRLLGEGAVVDFAYVDGMHTFDYVMLDAFYLDKLLPVGGVIGFNDCGFRSIHKFLRFFRSHRRYEELPTGLPANFRGSNPLFSLIRRITGRSNQDRYFRKLASWEPEHNFFRSF